MLGLTEYRYEFGEFVWKFNSPTWNFTTATYAQTAAAFDNPDYVPIVIGSHRWRLGLDPAEPEYAAIERRLEQAPAIAVPAITIDGRFDPFTPAGHGSTCRAKFTGSPAGQCSACRSSLRGTPSFVNELRRCHSTVRGLRKSPAPICRLVWLSLARTATCISCAVRSKPTVPVRPRTGSPVARSS